MDDELISDYLLGELSPELRARFERRLDSDDRLRAELERLRPVVANLEELPLAAWELIDAGAPKTAPAPRRKTRASRRWAFAGLATLLVLAGLGLGLGFGLDTSERGRQATLRTVELRPLRGTPASALAVARMTASDEMRLSVSGLPRLRHGSFYEIWLMTSTTDLVPVASFAVDRSGSATVSVPLPVPPTDYRFLDVSRQRIRQGTSISADSVLRGAIAAG